MHVIRDSIYSFRAKWFDTHAQLQRHFHVRYFVDSHNVEIFDTKTNKIFLKKSECPSTLSSKDFVVGAKVNLYGRNFELLDYLDPFTQEQLGKQQQKSILVLKGRTVQRVGSVLDVLLAQHFTLSRLKMVQIPRAQALKFYELQQTNAQVDLLSNSPVVVMELVAENCLEKLKQFVVTLRNRFSALENDQTASSLSINSNTSDGADATAGSNSKVAISDIDATISVLDVQRHREFFFETQHVSTAKFENCTCCVILPHILKEGIAGKVLHAIQESPGVEITALELFHLDRVTAAEFLEVYEGVVPHFNELVDHLTTGPCIAMELSAGSSTINAVSKFRENAGPWDVEMAKELKPNTIRARFGIDRVRNAVHCTDLPDDGVMESEYFFDILSKRQLKQ